jgi:hypothetical protein
LRDASGATRPFLTNLDVEGGWVDPVEDQIQQPGRLLRRLAQDHRSSSPPLPRCLQNRAQGHDVEEGHAVELDHHGAGSGQGMLEAGLQLRKGPEVELAHETDRTRTGREDPRQLDTPS